MKTNQRIFSTLFTFVFGLSCLVSPVRAANTITVTTLLDDTAANNNCTLREAVMALNTSTTVDLCVGLNADAIQLPAGTLILTIDGAGENGESGDLDILKDVTITGAGTTTTVIDGNGIDRVFHIYSPSTLTLSNLTVRGGDVRASIGLDALGGGVYNNGGTLNVNQSRITQNKAKNGGGIYNNGSLTMQNSTIDANLATSGGGAIFSAWRVTIESSTISGNTAENLSGGGGLYLQDSDPTQGVTINNSTISGNQVLQSDGSPVVGGKGGGIWVYYQVQLAVSSSTIIQNRAGQGGGIFNSHLQGALSLPPLAQAERITAAADSNVSAANTIIAENTGGVGYENCAVSSTLQVGPYLSLGSNIENGTTCGLLESSDLPDTFPMLRPLGYYGGPTQTHLPLPGSPVIDRGTACPALDQRGAARNDGDNNGSIICDIGSTEFNALIKLFLPFISK